MLDYITEDPDDEDDDDEDDPTGSSKTTKKGLTSSQIGLLFPEGLRTQMLASLDIDGTGVLTAIKLDRATHSIPRAASLLEVMFVLYEQRGKIVIPPVIRRSVEVAYLQVRLRRRFPIPKLMPCIVF